MTLTVGMPAHLRELARVSGDIELEVATPLTIAGILTALETRYPQLRGTIRDHGTLRRRPFIRFFANEEDWSHHPHDAELPANIREFWIIGAIAGG